MPLFGRRHAITSAIDSVEASTSVLFIADAGGGATAVLQECARRLEEQRRSAVVVRGKDGVSGVAFAPFGELLASIGLLSAPALEVSAVAAQAALDRGLILLIDDVDLLDDGSRLLADRLLRGRVPILATAKPQGTLPDALAAGIHDGTVVKVVLPPLDADAVAAFAAHRLGAEPSVATVANLVARSGGNPAVLGELVANGAAHAVTGIGGIDLPARLVTGAARLQWSSLYPTLEAEVALAVEQLAVAGGLPTADMPAAVVTSLRQLGLVEVADQVRLRSADLAEAVYESLAPQLRAIRALEASALLLGRRPHEATLLTVRAGAVPAAEDAASAAAGLLAAGRAADALEVTEAVAVPDEALMVSRGAALSALERHEEALAVLTAVHPRSDAVARERCRELGLLLAVRAHDPAAAVRAVEEALADVTDAASRAVVEGELVKWRMMAGMPGAAPENLIPAASADLRVGLSLIQAMVASLDAPPPDALQVVASGRAALADAANPALHAEELLSLSEFLAVCFDARVDVAERQAGTRRLAALAQGHDSVGMWEYVSAELALHAGRLDAAERFASRAVTHLGWRDFTGLRATALALHAAVCARQGDPRASADALARLPQGASGDVKVAMHVARAKAERALRSRDAGTAARLLAEAGEAGVAQSHRHLGVMLLDESWMVRPSPATTARLGELATSGALAAMLAARAEAHLDGDAASLMEHGAELVRVGLFGRGSHTLELAAGLWEAAGAHHEARRARAQARATRSFQEASAWPRGVIDGALTVRELEIAQLAAARVRSKEIAARLGLSVRTVDNHLGRVFRKLDILSREELESALAALGQPARSVQPRSDDGRPGEAER